MKNGYVNVSPAYPPKSLPKRASSKKSPEKENCLRMKGAAATAAQGGENPRAPGHAAPRRSAAARPHDLVPSPSALLPSKKSLSLLFFPNSAHARSGATATSEQRLRRESRSPRRLRGRSASAARPELRASSTTARTASATQQRLKRLAVVARRVAPERRREDETRSRGRGPAGRRAEKNRGARRRPRGGDEARDRQENEDGRRGSRRAPPRGGHASRPRARPRRATAPCRSAKRRRPPAGAAR